MKVKKKITPHPLFENYKKIIFYSSTGDSDFLLLFERNNADLKKLSSFV
jgi:hypothetical protein